MNNIYAINTAKAEFREGYNTGDVDRLLSVFADGFADLSAGVPSFFGEEAKSVLRSRTVNLFQKYRVMLVVTIMSIRVVHNTAYDFGWHTLTLVPHQGGTRSQLDAAILSFGAKGTTPSGGSSCSSITPMFLRPCRMTRSTCRQYTYNPRSNDATVALFGFLLNGGLELPSQAAETDLDPARGDSVLDRASFFTNSLHSWV